MDMTEKTLTTQEVYHGRIIRVRRDEVLLPNGNTSVREVVEHPGGVGILALEDDGSVLLVRQYRYAFGRTLLEIPAGKREKGEEPLTTATARSTISMSVLPSSFLISFFLPKAFFTHIVPYLRPKHKAFPVSAANFSPSAPHRPFSRR